MAGAATPTYCSPNIHATLALAGLCLNLQQSLRTVDFGCEERLPSVLMPDGVGSCCLQTVFGWTGRQKAASSSWARLPSP